MTLDDINQQLSQIANSGDPTFTQAAQYIQQIVQQATSGQMSPSDTQEILRDTQSQLAITQDMSNMQYKETLNACINGLILIAALSM